MTHVVDRIQRYGIASGRANNRIDNIFWKDTFTDSYQETANKSVEGEQICELELISINHAVDEEIWNREFPHMIVALRKDLKRYERVFPTHSKARRNFTGIDFLSLGAQNPADMDIFMIKSIAEYAQNGEKRYPFFVI